MRALNQMWPASIPRILWGRQVCPLCSGFQFTEAEALPRDTLLRLFALSPVRCVNCWRRYYWFLKKDR